jgi:hypothetical protein
MSYILDALKKAERDRLREDPKELDDFASSNWDPYQKATESNSVKYLVLVIGFLALLLVLVIYSGSVSQAPTTAEPGVIAVPQGEELLIPEPLAAQAASKVADAESPAREQLATAGRKALPPLTISGHMYIAEGSSSNRLFANQRTFRAGDKIDQHWTLVAIKLQGYEIQSADRFETLPYR